MINPLQLADELDQELAEFQQVEGVIREAQVRAQSGNLTRFDLYAIGHILDDLYNGMERIGHRIVKKIDQTELIGGNWHRELLDMISAPTGERPAVIRLPTLEQMQLYRSFRHRLRHMYGFELRWEQMQPLFDGALPMMNAFVVDVDQFINFLRMIAADNDDNA